MNLNFISLDLGWIMPILVMSNPCRFKKGRSEIATAPQSE